MSESIPDQLIRPVDELGFSKDFQLRCAQMQLSSLQQIFEIKPRELINRDGFSYHWLAELSQYLTQQGLLHLLQPIPGKNRDQYGAPSAGNNP